MASESVRHVYHVREAVNSVNASRAGNHEKAIPHASRELDAGPAHQAPCKVNGARQSIPARDPQTREESSEHRPRHAPVCSQAIRSELRKIELLDQIVTAHGTKSRDAGVDPDRFAAVYRRNELRPVVLASETEIDRKSTRLNSSHIPLSRM